MKKSKGFSAKVKDRIWALYKVHGTKWTAILTDLINEQRDGKISRTARLPADVRTVRSCIKERNKREDALAVGKIYSDPSIVKAREEHLSEIRALIEKLRSFQLVFMDRTQVYVNRTGDDQTEVEALENEPLYACLKEHIPIHALWEDYSIWRDCWALYRDECIKFCGVINEEVKKMREWPGVLSIHEQEIFLCIEEIINDDDIGPIRFSKSFPWIRGKRETLLANMNAILVTEIDAFTYKDKYREMVQRVVNSAELESVRDRYEKAVAAKNKVDICLDEILLGRKYIRHTCRLCPGQPDRP